MNRTEKRRRNIYYSIITLRAVLTFIAFIALFFDNKKEGTIAVGLFTIAALLSLGEKLYQRKKQKSLLRSFSDYLADRALVDFGALALVIKGTLPFWVFAVFLLKDVITIAIGTILVYKDFQREFKRSALGDIALFFQILALVPPMVGSLDWYLIWLSVTLTVASGIESLFYSEFRKIKSKRAIDEIRFANLLKFADTFTLLNAAFGLIGILFALKGWHTTSSIMLLLAVVADLFDGKVARAMNQENDFGKQLDSLADTVSFGVAPAIFGFGLIQTPIAMLAFIIFLFCGILRLARYNVSEIKGVYFGMPITLNGIIVPAIYFLQISYKFYPYIYLILGILMVSSIKIRKLL